MNKAFIIKNPKIANPHGLSLATLMPLLKNYYQYNPDANSVSATTIMKPARKVILKLREPEEDIIDTESYMPAFTGQLVHDSLEYFWKHLTEKDTKKVGYSLKELQGNIICEKRYARQIGEITITGKVDLILFNYLFDYKTTRAFVYTKEDHEDYRRQASIYKWLADGDIKGDTFNISFLFTDWSKALAERNPDYPQAKTLEKTYEFYSLEETQQYLEDKLTEVAKYVNVPEEELPLCTPADLWQGKPTFKYYKNPNKTDRSTKNFDTEQEARIKWKQDGGIGVIKRIDAKAVACNWCSSYDLCTQKDELLKQGLL